MPNSQKYWVLVYSDRDEKRNGQQVRPIDLPHELFGLLVFPDEGAAHAAAKEQMRLYGIVCRPVLLGQEANYPHNSNKNIYEHSCSCDNDHVRSNQLLKYNWFAAKREIDGKLERAEKTEVNRRLKALEKQVSELQSQIASSMK